jgi:hypothetical protein
MSTKQHVRAPVPASVPISLSVGVPVSVLSETKTNALRTKKAPYLKLPNEQWLH